MKITFIGTASGLTVPDRAHSSILFTSGKHCVLVDCGEGATVSLLKCGLDPNIIGTVVISHTHPDHCAGLPLLLQYMHLTKREEPLPIYFPQGASSAFAFCFQQMYLINEKLSFNYELKEYSAGEAFRVADLEVSATQNRHTEGYVPFAEKYELGLASFSLLFREKAKTAFYSADLVDIADLHPPESADLLIVECTHIGAEEALKFAFSRGIKRVVFTHIPPETDTSPITFKGISGTFAFDGLAVEL